ncbi:TetR/AcrR family transcriptional regulator [Psychrobacillus psychrodurans]|jgi:AcrR family transcriptional regulator|uniref:TetR/AcrR family transcriptional regulator n=1 Tax=Psychrobacillus TaxID=1221880 RepID=UPI000B80FA43|nr:TetR/AcrR family transcriptional regulator [Psychrobacillus psychrodurans]MCK1995694.1 TetR/AcrR family transcriptional regulator [Psychrobacillus psychrodurans]MCZ8538958.1 TetR/AcrR family transcriptional regulator [Psychrobacillus psychrodurans]
MEKKHEVKTSVKDENLIEKRREQMIRAAVTLFKEKGFHRATTREIAKEAGFSIGTLYEYIRTKEDVLYLVCDSIYNEVHNRLSQITLENGTAEDLKTAIRHYYGVIDDMSDEFVVMYQESKSLPKGALEYVLAKELEMVEIFHKIIIGCIQARELELTDAQAHLYAHTLVVQGQMWAFRRWALRKEYTIDQFTELQIELLLHGMK